MELNKINSNNNMRDLQSKCKKYLYCNVSLIMSDGSIFDGIIEDADQDRIAMLVGEDAMDLDDNDDKYNYDEKRQYGHGGFHRRPRRRFRRFRRRFFPFSNIVALELLSFLPSRHRHSH
ncbi:hypothetical protein [Clostridium beijerinckii]|uniref:LSM domain-containing protein n=1 Tax=Clostridium beijerinckii TaxID=1520 RepID=A0AAX0AXM6_CLOBE|nr:hypothetical protein [Clostridium beijerinckii]NRT87477.1 hypothetical protein [Clostridium beijerinckii]NYC72907.1 hypothetical protein [Clostridium beijerinckii]